MDHAPLTLDTLQSKTAESDPVFFFFCSKSTQLMLVLLFLAEELSLYQSFWLEQMTTVLLCDENIQLLLPPLSPAASVLHHHLPRLPLWSVNWPLGSNCQWIDCYWDLISSIWHSVNLFDNLSQGILSLCLSLPWQPLLVTGQHGQSLCVCVCFVCSYSWSLGCCSLSPSGGLTVFCPGDGACGGCVTAGGRVCVMGTALGTMPSTGGGRPPGGKLTTPGGYL